MNTTDFIGIKSLVLVSDPYFKITCPLILCKEDS